MSTISGYDSNSISTLLSSLNARNTMTSSNFLNLDLSTYATIQSGTYKKLLTSYYEKNPAGNSQETGSTTDNITDTASVASQKANATAVKKDAGSLVDAADHLDSYAMWQKKTTKQSDGTEVTDYDKDKIYQAVVSFKDGYNALIKDASSSADRSVLRSSANLIKNTKANTDLLKSVGITIDSSNKLNIDETKFKQADMTTVKSIFTGNASYGQTVASKASTMKNAATSQLTKLATTGTYSDNGSYNYLSGSNYNTYL